MPPKKTRTQLDAEGSYGTPRRHKLKPAADRVRGAAVRPAATQTTGRRSSVSPRVSSTGTGQAVVSTTDAAAIVQFGAPSSGVPRRQDSSSSDSDGVVVERQRHANWIIRCQDRWDSRCHTARAHGVSITTESRGIHVPETAANRRLLSRTEQLLSACSREAQLRLEEDTGPGRWEDEYLEASALDRAMRDHGLTDRECEALWLDGVETVAWLDQLRDEDFMEAGIDVKTRREQLAAEHRAQRAWEIKDQAEQRADPHALGANESLYDEEHFARMGRALDDRRRTAQKCDRDMQQARQRAEEASRAAKKRCQERDEERQLVEQLIQRYSMQTCDLI